MAVSARSSSQVDAALTILRGLLGERHDQEYAIRLWDGTYLGPPAPRFTLKINDPAALREALHAPVDLHVGRAFVAGLIECEGDVETAVDLIYDRTAALRLGDVRKLLPLALRLPKARLPKLHEAALHGKMHSLERDREAIGFHYDQPVDFFQTFLGTVLVYSCAYFDDGVQTLEDAQNAKIDYILRKLQLRSGERLLDIGCGWGTLVIRAAKLYGARACGVTLSRRQYEHAQQAIAQAGVADLAAVELRDYRELGDASFDKIASVGMFEHVGRSHLPEYFAGVYRLLRSGGLFMNHGISDQSPGRHGGKSAGFVERFVFPDGELVAVSDALMIAERAGFEVRDVENLREHYMRTLRCWVENLERNRVQAVAAAGEEAFRTWRLYMAGSAQGFRVGRIGLFQALLAKPRADGSSETALTRRHLYVAPM
ncbi:MAG: class I SAM-dependent methyltransferase [Vulcanimicrobiaceae bacterium]